MGRKECKLSECLYFSSNKFARTITKLAEDEFKITGLSPTYAFAVTVINKAEGIAAKRLAEYLDMAPSTITRFVDKLVTKGLAKRVIDGKNSFVHPTPDSIELQKSIDEAWTSLHNTCIEKLGAEKEKSLLGLMNEASEKLK